METLQQVQKTGRERLYPSLTNPNWLVLRKRAELFRTWLSKSLPPHPVVLDVGGRIQPFLSLLPGSKYLAIDILRTPLVTVVANAEQIPFSDQQFDLVLCTQMLEYVPDPGLVISEIQRVLKPGGTFILSVPSAFPRDAEEERWRFLPAGIRQLLAGFSQTEIVPEGGSIAGLFRTVNVCLHIFAKFPSMQRLLSYTLIPVLNLAGLGLERLARSQNDAFTVNYSVRARR